MDQIDKRSTAKQVKVLLRRYCQEILGGPVIEETLGISKSTFFVLLRAYRHNPDEFSLAYHEQTPRRIPARVKKAIEKRLMLQTIRLTILLCLSPLIIVRLSMSPPGIK